MSKQAKQLGSWGLVVALVASLLSALIPFAGIIVLVGWIVAIVGYFKASDELGEPDIKGNVIKALIAGIVAFIVFFLGGGTMMAGMISEIKGGGGMQFGGVGLLIMIIAWLIWSVAAWFWYKANSTLSEKTGVNLFKIGGLLMFAGAVLTIIVVGGLLSLIGEVLLIVAWFSVPEGAEAGQS